MDPVGIGILGSGPRGRSHAEYFNLIPNTRLMAFCDVEPGLAKTAAKDCEAKKHYQTYSELLKDSNIDLIVITTPDNQHAEHSLAALNAGKHVLSEIPLAYTYEECRKLIKAVERTDLKLFFGQQTRYWAIFKDIKRRVTEGELGNLYYVETEYLHNMADWYNRTPWRLDQTTMLGGGPHVVDILRWFIGEPVEVKAYSTNMGLGRPREDLTVALYHTEAGCIGRVLVAYGMIRPYSLSARLYGSKASFEQDTNPYTHTWYNHISHDNTDTKKIIPVKDPRVPKKVREQPHSEIHGDADYLQALEIIDSILYNTSPPIDVYEAARTTAACIAAQDSIKKGIAIRIPEF